MFFALLPIAGYLIIYQLTKSKLVSLLLLFGLTLLVISDNRLILVSTSIQSVISNTTFLQLLIIIFLIYLLASLYNYIGIIYKIEKFTSRYFNDKLSLIFYSIISGVINVDDIKIVKNNWLIFTSLKNYATSLFISIFSITVILVLINNNEYNIWLLILANFTAVTIIIKKMIDYIYKHNIIYSPRRNFGSFDYKKNYNTSKIKFLVSPSIGIIAGFLSTFLLGIIVFLVSLILFTVYEIYKNIDQEKEIKFFKNISQLMSQITKLIIAFFIFMIYNTIMSVALDQYINTPINIPLFYYTFLVIVIIIITKQTRSYIIGNLLMLPFISEIIQNLGIALTTLDSAILYLIPLFLSLIMDNTLKLISHDRRIITEAIFIAVVTILFLVILFITNSFWITYTIYIPFIIIYSIIHIKHIKVKN